jgi:hypothetical protein
VFVADRAAAARVAAAAPAAGIAGLTVLAVTDRPLGGLPLAEVVDREGLLRARYGGAAGVTYLLRPDQHVLGRWAAWDAAALGAAWRRCLTETHA